MNKVKENLLNLIKHRSCNILILLLLYFIFIGLFSSSLEAWDNWTGTTDQGQPMSFEVESMDGSHLWRNFILQFEWDPGSTIQVTIPGPDAVVNGQFSGFNSEGTFTFAGTFTSATTATGVYAIINYPNTIASSNSSIEEMEYISGTGTWIATGILPPCPPVVTTDPATLITDDSATLNGTVNPMGKSTDYYFEYGLTTSYGTSTATASAGLAFIPVPVNSGITGLSQNTTYHYRLVATNTDGTSYGNDMEFTSAAPPNVTTGTASSVTTDTATLNGTINPNGWDTNYYFEYGLNTSYGTATPIQSAGSGSGDVSVNEPISGLSSNTSYHYRLVATNAGGTNYGGDMTFSTLAPPAVTTGVATSITSDSASLNGTINPNGKSTNYHFEYGTTTSYGFTSAILIAGSGLSDVPISQPISELSSNTAYHYRLVATNADGTTNGDDMTFVTSAQPTVTTGGATSISSNSATLNGTINPNGLSTDYYFEYGLDLSYGTSTPTKSAGSGVAQVSVSESLTGLTQYTTYHYRLVAANAEGITFGNDGIFYTSASPTATTGAATSITSNSATLEGTINPNGLDTDYYFEYGLNTSYGTASTTQNAGSGTVDVPVSEPISGLSENTTYHYRLVATNADGTTNGGDQTFSSGLKTFSARTRLTWNSGESGNPSIAVDYNGYVHAVWNDNSPGNSEILYKKSTDGGTTWGSLRRITYNSGDSCCPSIAIDTSNNVHIVWHDNTPGNFEIFYKLSQTGGDTWGAFQRLTNNGGTSANPNLAIDSNYNVYVIWYDDSPGSSEIFFMRSRDAGATWGIARRLTYNYGTSEYPAISVDSRDNVHISWNYDTPGNNEIFYKRSTNSGVAWSAFKRMTFNTGSSLYVDIAANSHGDIHLTWQDFSPGNLEILYKKSTDNGKTWNSLNRITWNIGNSAFPAVAKDDSGNVAIIWQDLTPGDNEIFFKDSTDSGVSWKSLRRITYNSGQSSMPDIFLSSGDVHIIWTDDTPGNKEIFYKNRK